jgi:toxin ParE1/3/4
MPPKAESLILMSPPKFHLRLSDRAKLDFRDILSHTMQIWGERQFIEYKGIPDAALKQIERNPDLGRERLLPGFRSFQAGNHVIFYRIDESSIHVVRILHGRMDFTRHLSER